MQYAELNRSGRPTSQRSPSEEFQRLATDAPEIFVSELGDIAVNQGFKIKQIQKSDLAR